MSHAQRTPHNAQPASAARPHVSRLQRARRGVGLYLFLVLSVLVLLGGLGLHLSRQARSVAHRSVRAAWGETARQLAESAVAEAFQSISQQLNSPGTEIYGIVRRPVLAPALGSDGLTAYIQHDTIEQLLGEDDFGDFSLSDLEARILYRRPFGYFPEETFGLLRIRARVQADLRFGPTVSRQVETAHDLKVVRVTTPAPLDQATLFVSGGGGLTDLPEVNRKRARYLEAAASLRELLVEAEAGAPPEARGRYLEILAELPPREDLAERVPPLDEEVLGYLLGIWPDGQSYPLGALDLNHTLEREEGDLDDLLSRARSSGRRAIAASGGEGPHRQFIGAVESALKRLEHLLSRIWARFNGFERLSPGDASFPEVAAALREITPDHYRRKAFYRLHEADLGGRTFDTALASLRATLPVMSGVLVVENTEQPIRLSGDLPGRLVLVVGSGGVELSEVNAGVGPDDLLTVICFGGDVLLEGTVRASVVLMPGELDAAGESRKGSLTTRPGTVLEGTLALHGVRPSPRLEGTLVSDTRYSVGHDPGAHYHAGLSPWPVFKKVTR